MITDDRAARPPRVNIDDGFFFEVTGYQGFEPEILRLRNANRDHPENLDYLAWRYRLQAEVPAPRVFWLLTPDGHRIGMGSAIFRPYWVRGVRVRIAVIGDISLDAGWRGCGLGSRLLRYMTAWLDENYPRQPAFVIPTESARRTLANAGWVTPAALVPYVYVLDPARYLQTLVHSEWLALQIARVMRSLLRTLAALYVPSDADLRLTCTLEASLLEFSRRIPIPKRASRDLGPESLLWRYAQHPNIRFNFGAFSRAGELRGLVVFEETTLEHTCSVYDLVVIDNSDLRAMVGMLILRGLHSPSLHTLRILLDEHHPGRAALRRLGFIARGAAGVFQVHSSDNSAETLEWCVTQGDKDT